MFGYNDNFRLTATNTINKEGKMINYTLSFPVSEEDLIIPDNVIQMSVLEYHEGYQNYGYESFKICVGKTTSIKEMCELQQNNIEFYGNVLNNIETSNDKLCYLDDLTGKYSIFAKINDGDIVVENIEQLKDTLLLISNNFQNIKDSVLTIKGKGKLVKIRNQKKG